MVVDGISLNQFERAALEHLLRGAHPFLSSLRAQVEACVVVGREFTGVGFFTDLRVEPPISRAPSSRRHVHVTGVGARVDALENGVGFMLLVEDGFLKTLEGFTYDEPWPDAVETFSLIDETRRFEDPSLVDTRRWIEV